MLIFLLNLAVLLGSDFHWFNMCTGFDRYWVRFNGTTSNLTYAELYCIFTNPNAFDHIAFDQGGFEMTGAPEIVH